MAVMLSIRPEWCEKIISGEKTVEVRKTKPKLEPPFKCYIYCTKQREKTKCGINFICTDDLFRLPSGKIKVGYSGELMLHPTENWDQNNFLNGKVIGEFVCDAIFDFCFECNDWKALNPIEVPFTALSDRQIVEYLGNGKPGYGWHISNLVIYDKPLEIRSFMRKPCVFAASCGACVHSRWSEENYSKFIGCSFEVKRPPQSWCYVMEV